MAAIENFDTELAVLWDAASNKLRNKQQYVESLEALFKKKEITKKQMIIDVAGGYGFPSIDLEPILIGGLIISDAEYKIKRSLPYADRLLSTGEEREYPSRGYLLLEDEFIPLLAEAGFREIEKYNLKGDIYEGFFARK